MDSVSAVIVFALLFFFIAAVKWNCDDENSRNKGNWSEQMKFNDSMTKAIKEHLEFISKSNKNFINLLDALKDGGLIEFIIDEEENNEVTIPSIGWKENERI